MGVEGMSREVILEALRRAGVTEEGPTERAASPITKAEMYAMGLAGRPDSAERRDAVKRALALPQHLTANALLDVLNSLTTREELAGILSGIPQ